MIPDKPLFGHAYRGEIRQHTDETGHAKSSRMGDTVSVIQKQIRSLIEFLYRVEYGWGFPEE